VKAILRSAFVAIGAIGVYAAVVRPRMLRSGATTAEVEDPYPGADLVPDGIRGSTMAATIDAPPRAVWPWLVQMGHDRAGWYSWDRLDNFGHRSADRIHPEWQDVEVGDHMVSAPNGRYWFEVAALEPFRFLALRSCFDLRGRQLTAGQTRPRAYNDSVWCFRLDELPAGRTRLVVSTFASARPRLPNTVLNVVLWEPAHWIMQRRHFANLRHRIEPAALSTGRRGTGPSARLGRSKHPHTVAGRGRG